MSKRDASTMNVSAERVSEQIASILSAWGMDAALVRATTDVMLETDLAGIDSHGISMLMLYEDLRTAGRLNLKACLLYTSPSPRD